MKHLIRLTAGLVVFCLISSSVLFNGYCLTENASISASDFLSMTGEMISNYDTPFYIPESTTTVPFEKAID